MDQFCVGEGEEMGAGTDIVHVLTTINVEDFTLKTAQRCSRATKNVSNMGLTDQHDSCGVSMVA